MRLAWGKTFVIGLGFLSISAVWPLYDSYMPKFYGEFIASSALVGLIMGFDNILGLTLQPWFGAKSDRTRSRWGRRLPYLLIGMPVAALALLALPFGRSAGLIPLLAVTILLNLAMSMFRSPTIALMPDLTPSPLRSLANGVINLMGGIGAAVVLFTGATLYAMNPGYPFWLSAAILIVVFFCFLLFIREPAVSESSESVEQTPQSLLAALREIFSGSDKGSLLVFFALLVLFIGYQSANTWFTLYAEENLGVAVNVASRSLTYYAAAFVVFALPAGYLGTKIGRRKTIAAGIIGMVVLYTVVFFLKSMAMVSIALILLGACWALVNVNTYPMIVELCRPSQTGTYTGLYYIFQQVGGVSGPFLFGLLFDAVGSKRPLFITAAVFLVISGVLFLAARTGEAAPAGQAA